MKDLKVILLINAVACVTGCVSPFYGTARIEEGFHADIGLAGGAYLKSNATLSNYNWAFNPANPYYHAVRSDVELRYGLNKYIQGSVRAGLGLGFNGYVYDYEPREVDERDFFFDIALGPQFALPIIWEDVGHITPAFRLEACYGYGQFYLLPTLVLGFGNPEYLTLGGRFYHPEAEGIILPMELFTGIHLWRFNIFMGVNSLVTWLHPDFYRVPAVVTVGIAYKLK